MAKGARRNLTKESFWRRRIRRQATSGLSVRAWCRRHGQMESAFYWWRRELARRDSAGGELGRAEHSKTTFVPVQVEEDRTNSDEGQIEIVLAGQRCVRVSGRVDRQMLVDVLAVMEERAC